MYRKIITLFILLTTFLLQSQNYIYKEFGLNEGLPSSQVYNIYQDKNGIIWFATDRGIANYNGYEIKQFGVQDGILNNVVLDFHPQDDGTIYCTTFDNKLFYFNEDFKGFFPYKFNDVLSSYLKNSQTITNLYFDKKNGNLNIGCENLKGKLIISKNGKIISPSVNNYFKENEENFTTFETISNNVFYYYSDKTITNKTFNCINNHTKSKVEIITLKNGQYYVYRNFEKVIVFNNKGTKILQIKNSFSPLAIKAIDDTHFFIGYHFGGGKIVDINGKVLNHFLDQKSVTNFIKDHEGGYWFSTLHSGVFYVKDPRIRIFNYSELEAPIQSLCKNNNGKLFAGLNDGKIIKINHLNDSKIIYSPKNYSKSFVEFDSITKATYFKSGDFIAINEGFSNPLPYSFYVLKLSEPIENKIIISQINRISILDTKTKKIREISNLPFRVHDGCFYKNDIFLGTTKGVFLMSNNKIIDLKKKNPLFEYRVDDIDFNKARNELYFATLGNGVLVYNKKNEKVYAITKKDGLLSNIINEIHIENKNEIWVCTNSGLNKIEFQPDGRYNIKGLKSSNGLLNDGISDVEILNDTLWIASKKGLVYAPKNIFKNIVKNKSYFLKISSVQVNDFKSSIEKLTDLSYNENRIDFTFEGISFKNNNELIYQYKLEGLDTKWYYTSNRKIVFPSLPEGNYIFKVAVLTSKEEKATDYLEIPITINKAFWKNSWFILIIVLLIASVIYLFFRIRVLTYNKDITRELIRLIIKKIQRKEKYYVFKENGKEIRVKTNTILYVKSAGNYIDLFTENKNYTIRCKIGEFIDSTPDPLEYLRIHRSYIIRIDKVDIKSKNEVVINGEKIPVSTSFECEINKLIF